MLLPVGVNFKKMRNIATRKRHLSDKKILNDICKTMHSATVEHISFWHLHGTFTKIYHILAHKTSFNEF